MGVEGPHKGKRSRPLSLGDSLRKAIPSSPPPINSPDPKERNDPPARAPNFGKRSDKVPASKPDTKERSSIVKDLFSSDFNIDSIIDRIKDLGGKDEEVKKETGYPNFHRTRPTPKPVRMQSRPRQREPRKRTPGLTLADLDKMENEVGLLLKDIETLEKGMSHDPPKPRESPARASSKEKPVDLPKVEQAEGKKVSLESPFIKWLGSKDLKRYIPISFAILAPIIYALLTLRVVFKAPISQLFPIFIDPFHIFLILMVILGITIIANFVKRSKIKKSQSKSSPIWDGGVGQR